MAKTPDLYTLLGLSRDATPDEIKSAYREMARRFHPDANLDPEATELFLQAQKAYEVLSEPEKKARYDSSLSQDANAPSPLKVEIVYSRSRLLQITEPQLLYTLIRIEAKEGAELELNTPLNVCLVVDRSTSMQGALMDTVKETAIELVRQLRPQDVFSIVAFSDRAEVIIPAGSGWEKNKIETTIRMLQTGGGTEIYKGMEAGYYQVRRLKSKNHVNHILLITDGRTYGDEDTCIRLAEQAAFQGIGISSLGIGVKWNDAFLDTLATKTGGSCTFVSKPKDIHNYLKEKFNQLGSSVAENVGLNFKPSPHAELRYAFRIHPEATPLSIESPISLGSVLRDSGLVILLEFLINSIPSSIDSISLAAGRVLYDVPNQAEHKVSIRLELKAKISEDADNEPPPQVIVQAMSRLTLYRMQERARQDVASGRIKEATRRLQHIATHLLAQGNRELARTVLNEAIHIQENRIFSEGGEKRIKYSTRALLLPAGTEILIP